jgi:hypothetical protein
MTRSLGASLDKRLSTKPGPTPSRSGIQRRGEAIQPARTWSRLCFPGGRPLLPKGAHLSRGTPISYPGLAGRQLAAGVGGHVPAHRITAFVRRVTMCSSRGFLTDGEAPLCLSGRTRRLHRIARLSFFKPNPAGLTWPPSAPGPGRVAHHRLERVLRALRRLLGTEAHHA